MPGSSRICRHMANDPENPKYQQYLARLERALQSRFPMTIIVAIAVVTVAAILVFAKALPRRSPSARPELLTTTTQSGPAQLSEQSPAEVLQPQQTRQQGQMPVAAAS